MSAATEPTTLVALADTGASGALLCDAGTLYLADGEIVHAESPAAPGVDVLLTVSGRVSAENWQEAVDRAGADCRVGRFLVDSGRLSEGELELCHLAALFDAAYFALTADGGPRRFRPGAVHWLGTVRSVSAATVERESRRRVALLDRLWPYPKIDRAPVVPRPAVAPAAVTRRQRAVLDLADGVRSPARIAQALGRPAFHTLIDVRRLAAAGCVETPDPSTPPTPPSVPAWVAGVSADPDTALLIRLRDALEAHL